MTNTERQREFRKRNPGYYGRLHRARKAAIVARLEAMKVQQAVVVAVAEPVKVPLMLPAPAIVFEFPGINALPTRSIETREAVAIPVER